VNCFILRGQMVGTTFLPLSKRNWVNVVSQAHGSFTYTVGLLIIGLFSFGWLSLLFVLPVALILGMLERLFLNKRVDTPPENMAVVITGCSTGFGRTLTLNLSSRGIVVFAGVRKQQDAESLKGEAKCPDNVIPFIGDVTNVDQLQQAAEMVRNELTQSGKQLLGLINNAGFGYYGPVEVSSVSKTRQMFEVNVFGLIQASQAFIPLLREFGSKTPLRARIINISSGAGLVTIPHAGAYCASKYAVEALSNALRMELKPWNIQVAVVEPGRFKTEFQEKAYTKLEIEGIGKVSDEVKRHYTTLVDKTNEHSASRTRPPQEKCVQIIEDALFDTKPLARYKAGLDVQVGAPFADAIKQENILDRILGGSWTKLAK